MSNHANRRVALLAPLVAVITLAACTNGDLPNREALSTSSSRPQVTAPPTTAPPTTIRKATVPKVTGADLATAKRQLEQRDLQTVVKHQVTGEYSAGTVISQSRKPGIKVRPGTKITLVIAKAPPPPPPPPTDPPSTEPPPSDCHPSYPGSCLKIGAGDYDCAGGSGNGPNYVRGPIRVLGPDPFDLDRDGDGTGCD